MRDWLDLYTHGRRLNRIIRILEKRMKNTEDDDKVIRYANSIAILTREIADIVNTCLEVKKIIKAGKKIRDLAENPQLNS